MPDVARLLSSPSEIFDELRRGVLGQDDALREMSVALVKHLLGHPAGNILLIGNSGSGKTTIMKAVEAMFRSRPELAHYSNVVRINANVLADAHEGYGRAVLKRLFANAEKTLGAQASLPEILRWVERGIVFIDEVDKIRASVGETPNVRGIVAQEALLTLMENENLEFEVEAPLPATVAVNSSHILFVAGGAFEELYDAVYRRAVLGKDAAPLKPTVTVSSTGEMREELAFHLREYMRYEDLFLYGMSPQFVSRFESIIVLNDLREEDLAQIFIEPEQSIFRLSREYFQRFDIDLQITRGAIRAIAWEACRQKRLGARALKEVYRRLVRKLEFDPAGAKGSPTSGRRIVTIDEEWVKQTLK
ncbi:MAG TPA: AAA family ATPase [Thermoanaerobaculia bacterium]|nr:AAA family ATPase [Thermoanaerobaculia bacterium]